MLPTEQLLASCSRDSMRARRWVTSRDWSSIAVSALRTAGRRVGGQLHGPAEIQFTHQRPFSVCPFCLAQSPTHEVLVGPDHRHLLTPVSLAGVARPQR